MTISIRRADPQQDYERLAEIISAYGPEPVTADSLHEWDKRDPEGQVRRTVAVNADGRIVGYGGVVHNSWSPAGRFFIITIVDAGWQRQDIGRLLYEDNLTFARDAGATMLETWVFEKQPEGRRFAETCGFTVERHIFESTINLRTFDAAPFAGIVEAVEAPGIRLCSLADLGNTRDARYKLWEVNYATYLDDPASTGAFPDFDAFENIWDNSTWFRADGQIVALDGERYAGLSAVGYYKDSNSAYNLMTGVMPPYRGRGIAQALKVMSIRAAQAWGADYIRTNNDSQNAPMLAINRKLGYVAQTGGYRMTRPVSD